MHDHPLRPRPPAPEDGWALFLDVDGCLLDFADAPDRVRIPPGLRETLLALSGRLDGAVALVSGRPLDALDALFWPLRLPAAGLHGLERRSTHGTTAAPAPGTEVRRMAARAHALAARHPGALVENKQAGFALHWRAAPEAAGAMRAFAQEAAAALPGYRLQPGDHVAEVLPEGGDKGMAIARFLDEPPFAGRLPVFAGDDLTDEAGFRVVDARGGHAVLVGDRQDSAARFHLPGPAAVRARLAGAAAARGVAA